MITATLYPQVRVTFTATMDRLDRIATVAFALADQAGSGARDRFLQDVFHEVTDRKIDSTIRAYVTVIDTGRVAAAFQAELDATAEDIGKALQ